MYCYQPVCKRCSAVMSLVKSGTDSVFVCPYCGSTALAVESDRVKVAQIRSAAKSAPSVYAYRRYLDSLEEDKRMLPIRTGIILFVFLLVLILFLIFQFS